MLIRATPRFLAFFRKPEPQFIFIIFLLLVGFFALVYGLASEEQRGVVVAIFFGVLVVVALQAVHSLHLRKRMLLRERAFLSVCAHQVRTPLTAAHWAVKELEKPGVAGVAKEELQKNLTISFERIKNVTEALAQFAHLEDGQYAANPAHMDICEEIERAVADAAPIGKQYGVSVAAEGPCEELWVRVDPWQIGVVLSNLINNGIKYNHRGGVVTVSARALHGGKEIEVQVRDSGLGIPAQEQSRVFSRFFRGAVARRLGQEGSGLGLYFVKTIIEEHGGRVWLQSTEGKGSTFHFVLPAAR